VTEKFDLTEHTARDYLFQTYAKLGIASLVELVPKPSVVMSFRVNSAVPGCTLFLILETFHPPHLVQNRRNASAQAALEQAIWPLNKLFIAVISWQNPAPSEYSSRRILS
jgi:hypothetical protein